MYQSLKMQFKINFDIWPLSFIIFQDLIKQCQSYGGLCK